MSKKQKTVNANWYDAPVKRTFAIVSGFLFVASVGYGFAAIQKNIEFRMERYEMKLDFDQKLQKQIITCQEEKQALENKRVEALENVVNELSKKMKK